MLERASLSCEGRDSRPVPDRQEKAMFTHPDRIGQLAREHHHQMLAQASQRQLRHRHSRPAASTRIIRRLAAVIAGAGVVPAQAAGAIWPAGPHPLRRTSRSDSDSRPPPLTARPHCHAGSSIQPGTVAPPPRTAGGQNSRHLKRARISVMCRAFWSRLGVTIRTERRISRAGITSDRDAALSLLKSVTSLPTRRMAGKWWDRRVDERRKPDPSSVTSPESSPAPRSYTT